MAQTTTIIETWKYRDPSLASSLTQQQILGYDVAAIDGGIGKIDDATLETDRVTSWSTRVPGSSARRSCFRPASSRVPTMQTRRSS